MIQFRIKEEKKKKKRIYRKLSKILQRREYPGRKVNQDLTSGIHQVKNIHE